MSRNYTVGGVPTLKARRNFFDLSYGVKTAINVGTLYPMPPIEVVPGDTFKIIDGKVLRLSSEFLKPIMDNLYLDSYYFYVPSDLLQDNFEEIFSQATPNSWVTVPEANVVHGRVVGNDGNVSQGSIADYMGLYGSITADCDSATGTVNSVSLLPFRAFAKIYDEWFRDENLVDPMNIQSGQDGGNEPIDDQPWTADHYTGMPPKIAKRHDYFTSCLPNAQRGPSTFVPITGGGEIPVFTKASRVGNLPVGQTPLFWADATTGMPLVNNAVAQKRNFVLYSPNGAGNKMVSNVEESVASAATQNISVVPYNLFADMSGKAVMTSINDLRKAWQTQMFLERSARVGGRYIEYLQGAFGVFNNDLMLKRSEYLGGKRTPVSITQVTQTTGADSSSSPLAAVGAYSLSNGVSKMFKGFTRHGYVLHVIALRQIHTYQQGVSRMWRRRGRFDFYDRLFGHLGETPVWTSEIYNDGSTYKVPFGFLPAWEDLRLGISKITGAMRGNGSQADSLSIWHLGDWYDSPPVLGKEFIEETPVYLDRAITVEHSKMPQFIVDIWYNFKAWRELPLFGEPGLVDHNW